MGGDSSTGPRSCSCPTTTTCRAPTRLKGSARFTLSRTIPSLRMLGPRITIADLSTRLLPGGSPPTEWLCEFLFFWALSGFVGLMEMRVCGCVLFPLDKYIDGF